MKLKEEAKWRRKKRRSGSQEVRMKEEYLKSGNKEMNKENLRLIVIIDSFPWWKIEGQELNVLNFNI